MAYNPQDTSGGMSGDQELFEEGIHNARLVRVIELGEQDTQWGKKPQVVMAFLIPGSTIEIDGVDKQRMIWTFGLNKANNKDCTFNKYCRAINNKATSVDELIGMPCTVGIETAKRQADGTPYSKVSTVVAAMSGVTLPEADCDVYYFDWDNPSQEVWDKLSDRRKETIQSALNYQGSPVQQMLDGQRTSTSYSGTEEDSPI